MCDNNIPKKNQLNKNKKNIFITTNITENTTWCSKYNYILMNTIYVINSSILTIQPGTTIYANSIELSNPSSIPSLIIDSSSKLISNGTKQAPITFTSINRLTDIFSISSTTNKYDFNNNLGPFGEYWNGITISGTNYTNNNDPTTLINGIPYGGTNPNSYNFELSYTNIYFAGIQRFNSNSLTLGAPSFYNKLEHCEILFGQGPYLAIYGGSLLLNNNVFGFKYLYDNLLLQDGAQIYVIKNFFISAINNIDPNYLDVNQSNSFISVSTLLPSILAINRRSLLCANNNTFFSLTYKSNYITILDEGRSYSLNNLFIGNCNYVYDLSSVTDNETTLTVSNTFPGSFETNYIYIGPNTYDHINGTYYNGSYSLDIPTESSNTLKEIQFLFYGVDQNKLVSGHILDIIPSNQSDVYRNSTNYENNHLLPLIDNVYWTLLPNNSTYLKYKAPYYACGVIQKICDLQNYNTGFFGNLLIYKKYDICYIVPSYWSCLLQDDSDSSSSLSSSCSSSSSSSSSSCSSSSSSSCSSSYLKITRCYKCNKRTYNMRKYCEVCIEKAKNKQNKENKETKNKELKKSKNIKKENKETIISKVYQNITQNKMSQTLLLSTLLAGSLSLFNDEDSDSY